MAIHDDIRGVPLLVCCVLVTGTASAQSISGRCPEDTAETKGLSRLSLEELLELVARWTTIDARVGYQVSDWALLGVQATNVTDATAPLVKIQDYPFDYRSDGRRQMVTLDAEL